MGFFGPTYKRCDISTMLNDFFSNPLKANYNYANQYIEITGSLDVIDSEGKFITVYADESDMYGIYCTLQNDKQRRQVMNMQLGQIITIRGKCTDIDTIYGYYLDIDSIV